MTDVGDPEGEDTASGSWGSYTNGLAPEQRGQTLGSSCHTRLGVGLPLPQTGHQKGQLPCAEGSGL